MNPIDHHTLMAYVDGELDGETAKEVEERLSRDPQAQAIVAMYRETAGIVRSAILPYGHAPVPDHLVDAIRAGASDDIPRRTTGPNGWGRLVAALAAGLVLMVLSSGGGYLAAEYRFTALQTDRLQQQQAVERYRRDAVQTALTTLVSGKSLKWNSDNAVQGQIVPIRTFKNKKGQYCREYRDELSLDGQLNVQYGIACRHSDKIWRNTYFLLPADSSPATGGMQGVL
jgi:surface antigen